MANQQNSLVRSDGSGTGSRDFSYTFPTFKESEVKVEIDNVVKTLTTHYTIVNHNNSSGGTVRFNTTGLPDGTASSTPIRIFRQTDVDTPKAEFTAGAALKAQEINDNFKQVRHALQEAIGATYDNNGVVTSRQVQRYNIEADAIDGTLIADDSINSEHYAAGSIDLEHMSANSVDSDQYVDGSIDRIHLEADIIDGSKIENSAVNTEHIADNAVTTTEILNGAVTRAKLEADAVDGTKLADNAVNSEHYTDGSIGTIHLGAGIINSAKLADNAVNSQHYVDGSIDREHLEADIIDSTKLADNAVGSEHIQANAVTDSEIATGTLDNRYFTETELTNGALDGRYFTETESDARYFNVSTGDTIKDGDAFPDNDTTIATTAAINDRIIDLVDDVGGFVPIANEASFPTANPDVNNGSGTLVSIKGISSTRTPSGGTVTIANGAGTGNTVTITGCGSTVLTAGFGVIVETTSTLHTYAFHRLVPKATEVTTVAGISSNITTVANNTANINAVAADASDIGIVAADGTDIGLVAGSISNVNTTAGSIANVNTVAGSISNVNAVGTNISNVNSVAGNESNINSAVSNASNINSAVSNASNINTVAGSISNVNTTAGSISNVNTVASNISSVNSFANTYRIGSTNPTTSLDTGDLFFNTTTDSLKVYTGSAWVDGVTQTGNFALKTGNTFTGSNKYNDNVKAIFGTDSTSEIFNDGDDLFISHDDAGYFHLQGNYGVLLQRHDGTENLLRALSNGAVELYYDNSKKLETNSTGIRIDGQLTTVSNVGIGTTSPNLNSGYNTLTINSTNNGGALAFSISDSRKGLIYTESTGDLKIQTESGRDMHFATGGSTDRLQITSAGHVQIPADDKKLQIGANQDLEIFKDGNHVRIKDNQSANGYATCINSDHFRINDLANTDNMARFIKDGAAHLFYDNSLKFFTRNNGVEVSGSAFIRAEDASDSILLMYADDGDDHDDLWRLRATDSGSNFHLDNYASSSWETNIKAIGNGAVELYHNNIKTFETVANGIIAKGTEGADAFVYIFADEADDVADQYWLKTAADGTGLHIQNYVSGSTETNLRAVGNGAVELYYDNSKKLETSSTGINVLGQSNQGAVYLQNASGTTTGIINANTSGQFFVQHGNGEIILKGTQDGATNLCNNGVVKFETTSTGATITGSLSVDGFNLGDSEIGNFGSGNDLKIYHDGGNGSIQNTTGGLYLRTADLRITNSGVTENIARFFENGAVELYYDHSKKLETTSTGVNVTGRITTDSITIQDDGSSEPLLHLRADDSSPWAFVIGNDSYHSGTTSGIKYYVGNTGSTFQTIQGNSSFLTFSLQQSNGSTTNTGLKLNTSRGVELNYQGSKKFETTSAGATVTGTLTATSFSGDGSNLTGISSVGGSTGVDFNNSVKARFGTGNDLEIFHDGSNSHIADVGTGSLLIKGDVVNLGSNSGEYYFRGFENGGAYLRYDNANKAHTESSGLVITGGNHLRIANGAWTGNHAGKIQFHDNYLWFQGGSNGFVFRNPSGTNFVVINSSGHFEPQANNTYDMGTSSNRWRNVYTNDLNLSNEGSTNDVDGTWGDWTIQEGASDLFLKNNRSGKKYKFDLTEVS